MAAPFTLVSTSDWHLGVRRVPTAVLCDNLLGMLFPLLPKTKLLAITGDVFDAAVSMSDSIFPTIMTTLIALLQECERHDVTVRITRGTVSHDRTQSAIFPVLHEQYGFKNSLRYFDKITLEHIEHLGVKVLYLPDDLPYSSSEAVLREVQGKLDELGWATVDYAFVHGWFAHAVPDGTPHPPKILYRPEQFAFVTGCVLAGHVHTSSQCEHVYYNGSADRISHNEEEKKGCLFVENRGDRHAVTFVENKHAVPFVTVDLSAHSDPEAAAKAFRAAARKFPDGTLAYLRVLHPLSAMCRAMGAIAAKEFPWLHFAYKTLSEKTATAIEYDDVDLSTLTVPTRENLPSMIVEFHNIRRPGHPLTEARVAELLEAARQAKAA